MATKTKKRKTTSKSAKTSARGKKEEASLAEFETEMEESAFMDFAQDTKIELKKLGEQIHEATGKGVHKAKEIAEDVRKFAKDATNLTMLKMELHNLKTERDRLYAAMGKRLANLYKTSKLSNIKTSFKSDITKLRKLESEIKKKEKEAAGISL